MVDRFPNSRLPRSGRAFLPVLAFFVGFTTLLLIVVHYYLLPILPLFHEVGPAGKKRISASSMLILYVVLIILMIGMLWGLRVRRFFQSQRPTPPKPTQYVDAWKEAGNRLSIPTDDDEDEDDYPPRPTDN